MLTPDYQEFANRAGRATPWQYRDLWNWHGPNLPKSPRRCAFATPKNEHESGTFSRDAGKSGFPRPPPLS